jgi:F-type H+-transporting ATPase subunit gamma
MIVYGRKGLAHFSGLDVELVDTHVNNVPTMYEGLTAELAADLVVRLNENQFSVAYLAYNRFVSTMTQKPVLDQLLPMSVDVGEDAVTSDYLYEPSGQEILDDLLPMAMRTRVFQAFLDTEAGEQASRMTAMDNATRNAGEMIDKLTLQYNRARQAAITKELIEIISGAEAL